MQHRIFLVEPRPDLAPSAAQQHWREQHAGVFSGTPELAGYVQNRPLERYWPAIDARVCSEVWFADRDAERRGFTSDYYVQTVMPDEDRFVWRARAWAARVVREEVLRDGHPARLRVLAFGANASGLEVGPAASLLHLDRPTPGDGPPVVLSIWTDDEDAAADLAGTAGGLGFVAEPAVLLAPATWPWEAITPRS